MVSIIPYKSDHADLFVAREIDIERFGDDFYSGLSGALESAGVAFTAVEDGRILTLGGIAVTTLHTGYGWTMMSKYAAATPLAIARAVRRHLESIMEDFKLHRVETSNLAGAEDHNRWCQLLGFVEEGPLWQYDDKGRDYVRYVKLGKRGG